MQMKEGLCMSPIYFNPTRVSQTRVSQTRVFQTRVSQTRVTRCTVGQKNLFHALKEKKSFLYVIPLLRSKRTIYYSNNFFWSDLALFYIKKVHQTVLAHPVLYTVKHDFIKIQATFESKKASQPCFPLIVHMHVRCT